MSPGKALLWDVSAKAANGADLAASELQRFRVLRH
jgi:hypothetical protein